MTRITKAAAAVVCAAILIAGCVTGGSADGSVTLTQEEYERLARFEKLAAVMDYIEAYYYRDVDEGKMLERALEGLLSALEDPYTFYYNERAWSDLFADDGDVYGVGLQLLGNYETGTVTVTQVSRDGPADKAGIRKGDQLVRVDDFRVDAAAVNAAVRHMRGEKGSQVELEVIRGGERLVFAIYRGEIHIDRVEYAMLDDSVGCIVLRQFASDTGEEVSKALSDLEKQGAKSIVLDLRDNLGGWVSSAVAVADLFLDKALLMYAEYRDGSRDENWTKDGKTDVPLVILINQNSAASSEFLAGGLQNLGRAVLVGTNSYGNGIIQAVMPIDYSNTDGFQFTSAQWYFSDGTAIHGIGVAPDVTVEMPEELAGAGFDLGDMNDPQLLKAWEIARNR